ncbi:MAG: 16S rRNA (cytidine(1402)-2'-O)-methyltransferase [Elusimicrobia bacterium RIFCSPLOWO2_01_FULL_54_10]|nr:MAG: 16S rRNA (cytidine(1402)-2'-O)-methyltransferase [Elusimicrobia bacterium RIFCSPLOWO2_01_FULL_54_10]
MSGGVLHVVATPIGNLSDISPRALEVIKASDWVACEDTRRTLKLFNHYGITRRLVTLIGPKERAQSAKILRLLEEGQSVALLTDAGTPALSDPGNLLVASAREAGISVLPVPGPSAPAALASVSGLCADGFIFLGFLPRKKSKIRKELESSSSLGIPVIFFESPYRVQETLGIALEVLGPDARCVVGREMTKKFEEYVSGTLAQVAEKLSAKEMLGEFTVLIAPKP